MSGPSELRGTATSFTMRPQLLGRARNARILNQHGVARGEKNARQQIERLRRAECGDDVRGPACHASLHEARGKLFPQFRETLRRTRLQAWGRRC